MKDYRLQIIHGVRVHVEITKTMSPYCGYESLYIVPEGDAKEIMQTIDGLKNQLAIARVRYDNVLKGLRYWEGRALQHDTLEITEPLCFGEAAF